MLFPHSLKIWDCMWSTGPEEMTVITFQVNVQVYVEMRSGNASGHRGEDEKSFLSGKTKTHWHGQRKVQISMQSQLDGGNWRKWSMTRLHPAKLIFQLQYVKAETWWKNICEVHNPKKMRMSSDVSYLFYADDPQMYPLTYSLRLDPKFDILVSRGGANSTCNLFFSYEIPKLYFDMIKLPDRQQKSYY